MYFRILYDSKGVYCPSLSKLVISTHVTLFESKSYFEKECSLIESDEDDPMYFILNPT